MTLTQKQVPRGGSERASESARERESERVAVYDMIQYNIIYYNTKQTNII